MAKRRKLPNGFGSIARVKKTASGNIRKNQYRARLSEKYGRKSIGYFKTWNQAFDAIANYKEPIKTETFKDFYLKFRSSTAFKKYVKSTQNRYDRAFERFEDLYDREIHTIVYSELQAVIDQMELEGYTYTKNGELIHEDYSKSSIERLKHCLNKIFLIALKDNIIQYNPVQYIEVGGIKEKRVKEIFKQAEIEKLYQSIPYNPNARHVLCLIFTGMRTGEYLYLNKKNIHLNEHTITNFGIKTEAGRKRIMFIHPKIKHIMTSLYNESRTGNILEYNKSAIKYDSEFYNKIYYPALDKAGIKRKIPYTCRYTFATILYYSGVDPRVIKELLGHTSFEVAQKFYIQDKEGMQEYMYEEFKKI
ncbi:site-specific integrase [uncultured Anaerococcus sp.]|uniref:tyrosine-type recombinase/integrase n=1 Tax=uncultured Anaerococcus sp. TaxID=293428 RepID=UPI0026320E75|nr:site-specific integrase [uncultured Anaerococcus sp.]